MAIRIDAIVDAINDNINWARENGENVDISDIIHETIDGALVYDSDIVEYWVRNDMPDNDGNSIMTAIAYAVYEDIFDRVHELLN